jgi:photosystem II stability/assembly factor-like uncharacterized protein
MRALAPEVPVVRYLSPIESGLDVGIVNHEIITATIMVKRSGRYLLIVLVHAIAGSIAALGQGDWNPINTPANEDLASIHFPTATTGYAMGDAGAAVKTTDGGATWSALATGFPGKLWYTRFLNAETGIAVGDNGAAIMTTNGGATWTPLATGLKAGTLPTFLFGLQFVTAQTIFAVGGDGEAGSGVVIKSTDGGVTWSKKHIPGTFFLDRCSFVDESHGYAVGASFTGGGAIFVTTDGGSTWTLGQSAPAIVTSVAALGPSKALAVGSGGMAYATADGGATWSTATISPGTDLLDLAFRDANNGIAVGDPGTVLTTADGGATWSTETISGGGFLAGVAIAPGGGSTFIAGPGGVVYRRTIALSAPADPLEKGDDVSLPAGPMLTVAGD